MKEDRRRDIRHTPKGHAYASLEGNLGFVGRIADIGLSGLSLEYMADAPPEKTTEKVDIFVSDGHFMMTAVPCRMIHQSKVNSLKLDQVHGNDYQKYRIGLAFGNLKKNQWGKLAHFLETHMHRE